MTRMAARRVINAQASLPVKARRDMVHLLLYPCEATGPSGTNCQLNTSVNCIGAMRARRRPCLGAAMRFTCSSLQHGPRKACIGVTLDATSAHSRARCGVCAGDRALRRLLVAHESRPAFHAPIMSTLARWWAPIEPAGRKNYACSTRARGIHRRRQGPGKHPVEPSRAAAAQAAPGDRAHARRGT